MPNIMYHEFLNGGYITLSLESIMGVFQQGRTQNVRNVILANKKDEMIHCVPAGKRPMLLRNWLNVS